MNSTKPTRSATFLGEKSGVDGGRRGSSGFVAVMLQATHEGAITMYWKAPRSSKSRLSSGKERRREGDLERSRSSRKRIM